MAWVSSRPLNIHLFPFQSRSYKFIGKTGVLELPNLIYQVRVSGMWFLSSNWRKERFYMFSFGMTVCS